LNGWPPIWDDAAERIDGAEQSIDGPLFDDRDGLPRAQLCGSERRPFVMPPPRIS